MKTTSPDGLLAGSPLYLVMFRRPGMAMVQSSRLVKRDTTTGEAELGQPQSQGDEEGEELEVWSLDLKK